MKHKKKEKSGKEGITEGRNGGICDDDESNGVVIMMMMMMMMLSVVGLGIGWG